MPPRHTLVGTLGLLLLLAGGAVSQLRPADRAIWGGALLLGAAGLLALCYLEFARLRVLLARRSTRYGLNLAAMVALLLAIIVLIEILAVRHNFTWDLTPGKRYTLSDQTVKAVRGLGTDVKATAFYRPPGRDVFEDRRAAEDLLRRYANLSPRFRYEFVDPDRDPGRARRYGISQYGTAVLEARAAQPSPPPTAGSTATGTTTQQPGGAAAKPGEKPVGPALGEAPGQEEKLFDLDEERLTNALLKVTRGGKHVIYSVVGHGERGIQDGGREGYSTIRTQIEKANYRVKELLLLREPAVPADAAVVVLAGPRKDLQEQERGLLSAYIARGGKLLVALDPNQAQDLKPFLAQYGIRVGDDAVIDVDPRSQLFGGSELAPIVSRYSATHPITREFGNMATMFPLTRSVEPADKAPEGASVEKLVETGPQSFRGRLEGTQVVFDPAKDKRGSVPIGVIATVEAKAEQGKPKEGEAPKEAREGEAKRPKARIVVFGTSSFASNSFVGFSGNRDLFLNTVSWLAEEEELIAIRPREARSTPFFLTAFQGMLLFWVPVAVLPGLVAASGMTVWLRRRRTR